MDKLLAETSPFPNVMYEIGNELGRRTRAWTGHGIGIEFIRHRNNHLITYNGLKG